MSNSNALIVVDLHIIWPDFRSDFHCNFKHSSYYNKHNVYNNKIHGWSRSKIYLNIISVAVLTSGSSLGMQQSWTFIFI
jgi:hypothetical protein